MDEEGARAAFWDELESKRYIVWKNVYPTLDDYESGVGYPFLVKRAHTLCEPWEFEGTLFEEWDF